MVQDHQMLHMKLWLWTTEEKLLLMVQGSTRLNSSDISSQEANEKSLAETLNSQSNSADVIWSDRVGLSTRVFLSVLWLPETLHVAELFCLVTFETVPNLLLFIEKRALLMLYAFPLLNAALFGQSHCC